MVRIAEARGRGEQRKKPVEVLVEDEKTEPVIERGKVRESEADGAFRGKLEVLQGKVSQINALLLDPSPSREEISKRLAGVANALAAARMTYKIAVGEIHIQTPVENSFLLLEGRLMVMGTRVRALFEAQPAPSVEAERPVEKKEKKPRRASKPRQLKAVAPRVRAVPDHLQAASPDADAFKPDLSQVLIPPEFRIEQKTESYGDRLRHGFSYLWNRGNEAAEESIAYHIRGEKTPEELGERERTSFGVAASFAASLTRTAMSYGGVAVAPDFVRYLAHSHYTSTERSQLREVISAAVTERRRVDKEAVGYDALREKSLRMVERIEASRYLSKEDKARLRARIREAVAGQEERREKTDIDFNQEIAKIVDDAVVDRTSHTQRTRENTAFALTGIHLLRAPAYAGFALAERYAEVTKDLSPDAVTVERVRRMMVDEFRAAAEIWNGKTSRERAYAGLKTLRKVVLAGAMGYASTNGLWEAMPTMDTMTAGDLHERIDDALKVQTAGDAVHVLHELADHEAVLGGTETLGEHGAQEAFQHVGDMHAEASHAASFELPPGFTEGTVHKADGITQALIRVIEQDPKHYGYEGADDPLPIYLFAKKLSHTMAKHDGLLRTWLSDSAKENVIVVPMMKPDGWHVGFLSARTHEEISGSALQAYTKPEPRR